MSGPALTRVLDALERIGHPARPSGAEYIARCPAHDDRKPSLAVGEKSGKVVLFCHVRCRNDDILRHLSLNFGDLFDQPLDRKSQGMVARTVKEYGYADLNGGLVGIETRQPAGREGKRPVYPMTPNPDGSWSAKASEALKTTPFQLPLVVAAVDRGDPVWIAEGPSDATTLTQCCGVVATSNQGGAGKWTAAHSHWVKGADVIVCLDRDTAGDEHGRVVLATVADVAHSVTVKRPPAPHKDVTELIEAGGTLDQLETVDIAKLLGQAPEPLAPDGASPQDAPDEGEDRRNADTDPDSWAPIDLGPYLRGEIVRPEPSLGMARTDGLRLLYPGKEHACIGEMESGKSWFALGCVAAELNAANHVVYVHFEECDPSDSVDRLVALQVRDQDILRFLRFVGPERQVSPEALAELLQPAPSLVVFDGVNEAMALHRWAIREEDGAAEFRRRLVKPCTRVGAAVLSLDHVVKDAERRARTALGSVHKVNGLSGALILLENVEPFGRGQRGRSHVHVMKDRPGFLRRHGRPDPKVPGKTFMGEFVIDDTRRFVPVLEATFHALKGDDGTAESTKGGAPSLADEVFAVVAALPGKAVTSERELFAQCRKAGIKARESLIRDAVDDLIADSRLIHVTGKRGAKGYQTLADCDPRSNPVSPS